MALTALYMRKGGAEDMFLDADTHSVPVSSTTNRNVTGLAAYFLRIDGTSTGTGDWLTTGKMTASYFVATHASTPSVFPVATVSTTLNVVNASTFQVDATSLDCAVAANFTAAVALTGGGTANTFVVGADPTGSEVLRAASAKFTTLTTGAGTVSFGGNTEVLGTFGVAGAVGFGAALTVVGASTLTGAVALNGGATVPSGQTLTINSGGTLTVNGTLGITTLTASTATIAGASGGSEALRTTTLRATGASVFTNTVTMSSTLSVASTATFASLSSTGEASITSAGGFTNAGTANYFELPATADTGAGASLDLDALSTKNSHLFNPTSGARSITSIAGTRKGVYWLVNAHASNAVTFADALVAYPTSATFVLSANSTAMVYWDNTSLTVICKYS